MKRPDALLKVGVITSAHGIRGQVKIHTFTDLPEDILSRGTLTDEKGTREFKLTLHGRKEELLIAAIEGITDRNEAELLKGKTLYGRASARPAKGKDAWYQDELIGLKAQLSDGTVYGKVIGIYNFGAGDIIEIEHEKDKTEMIPFKEPFVGDVHTDRGYIIVTPPEYLEAKE